MHPSSSIQTTEQAIMSNQQIRYRNKGKGFGSRSGRGPLEMQEWRRLGKRLSEQKIRSEKKKKLMEVMDLPLNKYLHNKHEDGEMFGFKYEEYLSNKKEMVLWDAPEDSTFLGKMNPDILSMILGDVVGNHPGLSHNNNKSKVLGTISNPGSGQGKYVMFPPIGSVEPGNKLLSNRLKLANYTLAADVMNHVLKRDDMLTKIENHDWHFGAGLVVTKETGHQVPHIDFQDEPLEVKQNGDQTFNPINKEDMTWVVHIPLQKEGAVLSLWEPLPKEEGDDPSRHMYVYIPFGCYFCTRSDRIHSGIYGMEGNCRYHMYIRKGNMIANHVQTMFQGDKRLRTQEFTGDVEEFMKKEMKDLSEKYLKNICGSLMKKSLGSYTEDDLMEGMERLNFT